MYLLIPFFKMLRIGFLKLFNFMIIVQGCKSTNKLKYFQAFR
jgi:hypothetical protein